MCLLYNNYMFQADRSLTKKLGSVLLFISITHVLLIFVSSFDLL
uniref:Uncharacterized protein n=1 Tax=Rhizophora mucronata TaxID=61149 RepID=A0A2P2KI72_RHIMU